MRVTLVTIGSRGDVQPFVALGAGLRARGHAVRLVTHDEFHWLVEEAQLEHCGLPDMASMIAAEAAHTPLRLVRALVRALDWITPELVTRTLSACEDADLVVDTVICHTEALGRLAVPSCTALHVPLVATGAFPASGFPRLPLGSTYNRMTFRAVFRFQDLPLGRLLGIASREIRLPWRELGRERLALLAFSPTVAAPAADWPPACHVTGYWLWERAYEPPDELVTFLDRAPAPVALTFGSLWPLAPANAIEVAAECAHRSGRPLVVVGGPQGSLPDGVIQVGEADHRWLFPRTSAVIHHGGAGTAAAALHAGVPQVVAPVLR